MSMRAILHADMRDDALIDRFVAHVNASGLCEEPIRRSDAIDWLPAFEERLPRRLPPTSSKMALAPHSFRSVARHLGAPPPPHSSEKSTLVPSLLNVAECQ